MRKPGVLTVATASPSAGGIIAGASRRAVRADRAGAAGPSALGYPGWRLRARRVSLLLNVTGVKGAPVDTAPRLRPDRSA
ncbi:hypothetical protein, partial [Gemmatimonas sp.]|uniref:hypothetical protein n=1 Tax=Gemmatimonas sp. TaxID=1962908 RepID=UPI00391F5727